MATTMVTPDTGDHPNEGGGADPNDLHKSKGSSRQEKDLLMRLVGNAVVDDDDEEERSLKRSTTVAVELLGDRLDWVRSRNDHLGLVQSMGYCLDGERLRSDCLGGGGGD